MRRLLTVLGILAVPALAVACGDDAVDPGAPANGIPDSSLPDRAAPAQDSGKDTSVPIEDASVKDAQSSFDAADARDAVSDASDASSPSDASDASDAGRDASADGGFVAPILDGKIEPGEYGVHTDGLNQQSIAQDKPYTWFATWDDDYLYLGVKHISGFDPAVIYIATDGPSAPSDAGADAEAGADAGDSGARGTRVLLPNYDDVNGTLAFGADFALYWKNDYDEYRTSDAPSAWSAQQAGRMNSLQGARAWTYDAAAQLDQREIRIPWSTIRTGGRPRAFRFVAYGVKSKQFIAQVPTSNLGGAADAGANGDFTKWFEVADTAAVKAPFAVVAP